MMTRTGVNKPICSSGFHEGVVGYWCIRNLGLEGPTLLSNMPTFVTDLTYNIIVWIGATVPVVVVLTIGVGIMVIVVAIDMGIVVAVDRVIMIVVEVRAMSCRSWMCEIGSGG
ncbi:hypothetical protein L484_025879 [Morus notabilis]|uniref:Uncharacterized protein n=1 Tax=Morus notabilis TaxID=981085 RepID=W9RR50_9ROSA|nr:hypothetical protein L484_025879 [Morus notabilis]